MTLFKVILIALSLFTVKSYCEELSIPLLLQEALYTEETEGDIEKAIKQYENVIALTANDTSAVIRETINKVEFHLGLCYLKQGDEARAITQFKKVLEQFEGHDKIKNLARNYLQELNPEFNEKQIIPELLPAPWKSGEQTHYTVYAQNGGEIGTIVNRVRDTTLNNIKCYSIDKSKIVPQNWLPTFSSVIVDGRSHLPYSSFSKYGREMEWSVTYSGKTIHYTSNKRGKKTENTTDIDNPVFDDEATQFLLRRIPLSVGYRDSALVFNNMNGMYVKGQVVVESMEDITVPMGTFNCYKLLVTSSFQGDQNYEETFWVSSDKNRYIVQTVSEKSTTKLSRVSHSLPASNVILDERSELSVTLPKEYLYYNSLTTWYYKSIYHIFTEKTMAMVRLKQQKRTKGKSSAEMIDNEIAELKSHHKKYSLRKSDTRTTTINGIEVFQHVADAKEKYDPMAVVEYRTYFFTEEYMYCLLFLTNRDHFERDREEFDSIIESVTLK